MEVLILAEQKWQRKLTHIYKRLTQASSPIIHICSNRASGHIPENTWIKDDSRASTLRTARGDLIV